MAQVVFLLRLLHKRKSDIACECGKQIFHDWFVTHGTATFTAVDGTSYTPCEMITSPIARQAKSSLHPRHSMHGLRTHEHE